MLEVVVVEVVVVVVVVALQKCAHCKTSIVKM